MKPPENETPPGDQPEGTQDQNKGQTNTGYRRQTIGFFAMLQSDIWSNPKIVAAGPHGALVYIFALTRNASRGRTGVLPASDLAPPYVARQLGISAQEASLALAACVEADLLSVDPDTAEVLIVGWSEEWKRGPLTEAERIRKQSYRERKREKEEPKEPKKEKKRETQTQNRGVRDMSRTGKERVWGVTSDSRLHPPITKDEEALAWKIVHTIRSYSGLTDADGSSWSSNMEREHLAWLMRSGYDPASLERLAAYMCDDEGAGWANREKDGNFYMRSNCTVFGIFSEKNLRTHHSGARVWQPEYSSWEPRIKAEEKKAS